MAGSYETPFYSVNRYGYHLKSTGEKFDRVTTVKNVVGGGDALTNWAAREVHKAVLALVDSHRTGRLDYDALLISLCDDKLAQAHNRIRDNAADFGTTFHELVDAWAKGEKVALPADADLMIRATHFLEWEKRVRPTWVMNEFPIFNRTEGYAGTCDAIVDIGDERLILDVKTSRSVHKDYALQLAAYRYAEFTLDPETGEEIPIPAVDDTSILHVTPTGCQLYRLSAGRDQYKAFLSCRDLLMWRRSQKDPVEYSPALNLFDTKTIEAAFA